MPNANHASTAAAAPRTWHAAPTTATPARPHRYTLMSQRLVGQRWPAGGRWEELLLRQGSDEGTAKILARARTHQGARTLDAQTFNRAVAWLARTPELGRVSVNLSIDTLRHPACVEGWLATLDAWGVDARRLCIDLPGHLAPPTDRLTLASVRRLHAANLTVALDDVGEHEGPLRWCDTGMVSVLKATRTVLDASRWEQSQPRLLEGLAAFAAKLGLELAVTGIATAQEARRVAELGAFVSAQGTYIERPVVLDLPGWTTSVG